MQKFWRVWLIVVGAAMAIQFSMSVNFAAEKIEQVELKSDFFGWTRTNQKLRHTVDNGNSWREITPPKSPSESLTGASFIDENKGFVLISSATAVKLARTTDSGLSWKLNNVELPAEILNEAALSNAWLNFTDTKNGLLILRLASSSNFNGYAAFATKDGGDSWVLLDKSFQRGELSIEKYAAKFDSKHFSSTAFVNQNPIQFSAATKLQISFSIELSSTENAVDASFADARSGWLLIAGSDCAGFKQNCGQNLKLVATNDGGANWREITPPLEISGQDFFTERSSPVNLLSLPPGGSTRISLNRGFDKCTAATISQMQTWWNNSPFYDANIYLSGRNRGCTQAQLTANWINQVSAQGWGLIPTIVGYQAPCSVCTSCQKHSEDITIAETQGRGEADIAIADANALGLTAGTVLYYDMERYDNPAGTTACSTAVKSFLKGWTNRVKEQGYISGVYGSPTNAQADWRNITPAASQPDAVWMARWNNNPAVFGAAMAPLLDDVWTNHQRIHQYVAPHNETWGGVTFNIDSNSSDAPVAAAAAPRNKRADFDGDGKSDFSVFRAASNEWLISQSSNSQYYGAAFGAAGDVLAPGDFDADGRTDFAVWRPDSGGWFVLSRNTMFRAAQWGVSGDIPAAADYDGDRRDDLAVFRPSNGVWYIINSLDVNGNPFRSVQFGQAGDLPVPGDYDGDGKADLAVFRPSNSTWYILGSSAGFYGGQFGAPDDKPVQADYDGDGKTDFAVWRPSTGVWYLLQSTAGFTAVQWGVAADRLAPGDYDNDNKTDLAVFRPENGIWYVLTRQNNFLAAQFGVAADKPVAAGYIPQ